MFWRSIIDAYKTSKGCATCGFRSERGGYFDLDHVERPEVGRSKPISIMMQGLNPKREDHLQRLMDELAKCQVLCVACHREKTGLDLASDWGY